MMNWFINRIKTRPLRVADLTFSCSDGKYQALSNHPYYHITVTEPSLLYPAFCEACDRVGLSVDEIEMYELLGQSYRFEVV